MWKSWSGVSNAEGAWALVTHHEGAEHVLNVGDKVVEKTRLFDWLNKHIRSPEALEDLFHDLVHTPGGYCGRSGP